MELMLISVHDLVFDDYARSRRAEAAAYRLGSPSAIVGAIARVAGGLASASAGLQRWADGATEAPSASTTGQLVSR